VPRMTPDDLLAAVPDGVRSDQTTASPMLQDVQQQIRERAREAVRKRIESSLPGASDSPSVGKPAALRSVPPLSPSGPVEIRLDKGRRVRATIVPGAARRDDVAAFREANATNTRRAFEALQEQSEAIESLRRSQTELTRKVAALQAQSDRSVVGLLQGMAGLEQRLQTTKVRERVLRTQNLSARTMAARQQRALNSMATTARIQQVNAVVNSVQSAAFGEKGSLLATNNLLLAANQLLWTFIDPILRGMGFALGPSPSLLTWLSPVGSLLTGQVALGNRQHVRFISGIANFDGTSNLVTESLRSRLADGFFKEFRRRTDVPITAVALDVTISSRIVAFVRDGTVFIAFESEAAQTGRVAWIVDTGVDGG
jgi:hypothetical protein